MYKLVYRKKNIQQKIDELQRIINDEIPKALSNPNINADNAADVLNPLEMAANTLVLELCLGADWNPKKRKLSFHGHLPGPDQVAAITEIIDTLNKYSTVSADELGLPVDSVLGEKPKKKTINEAIGADNSILGMAFRPSDIAKLTAVGYRIRKGEILTTTLVIGGITLALVGAGVAFVVFNKKKNDQTCEEDIPEDDLNEIDLDDDEIGDVEIPDDEIDHMDEDIIDVQ